MIDRVDRVLLTEVLAMRNLAVYRLALAMPVAALAQTEAVQKFEVVSIRPSTDDPHGTSMHVSGNRLEWHNAEVASIIRFAYRPNGQVLELPGWRTQLYTIAAIASSDVRLTVENVRPFLKALLEEKFQLKFHGQPRQVQIYNLVVAKGGIKMKPADPDSRSTPFQP